MMPKGESESHVMQILICSNVKPWIYITINIYIYIYKLEI